MYTVTHADSLTHLCAASIVWHAQLPCTHEVKDIVMKVVVGMNRVQIGDTLGWRLRALGLRS